MYEREQSTIALHLGISLDQIRLSNNPKLSKKERYCYEKSLAESTIKDITKITNDLITRTRISSGFNDWLLNLANKSVDDFESEFHTFSDIECNQS